MRPHRSFRFLLALCVLMGRLGLYWPYASLCNIISFYRSLCVLMGFYVSLLFPMRSYGVIIGSFAF